MKTGLQCFVAMAVERDDTDRVYKRQILPILTKAGIHSVFMGTLEHNDDIDKRIMKEIEKADLVIADLTYARPSVYFEAGYAQRVVPVIYTVRKDHFRARPDDDHGNLRVHFDLQMRNIIGWRDSRDEQFGRRLLKRINLVTRPMLVNKERENQLREEREVFRTLPLSSRLKTVAEITREALIREGYRTIRERDNLLWPWVGRRPQGSTMNLCMLNVQASFTSREIRSELNNLFKVAKSRFDVPDDHDPNQVYQWRIQFGGYRMPNRTETKHVKQIMLQLILCSLSNISRGRIATALPDFFGTGTGHVFSWSGDHPVNHKQFLPTTAAVHILDDIQSTTDAKAKSKSLFG